MHAVALEAREQWIQEAIIQLIDGYTVDRLSVSSSIGNIIRYGGFMRCMSQVALIRFNGFGLVRRFGAIVVYCGCELQIAGTNLD